MNELAWYIYCIQTEGNVAPAVGGILPETKVHAISASGFTVLASQVPRSAFDQNSPECCTADPHWMSSRIEAHHTVNAAAAIHAATLPLTFGVLFSGLDPLVNWLEVHLDALNSALTAVAGRAEWALTLSEIAVAHSEWLDDHDPDLKRLTADLASAGQGTGFLLTRQRDRVRQSARIRHLRDVAQSLSDALDTSVIKVIPSSGDPSRLAWTLLAPVDAPVPEIADALAQSLTSTGLALRLTGPWPPYAFARNALTESQRNA